VSMRYLFQLIPIHYLIRRTLFAYPRRAEEPSQITYDGASVVFGQSVRVGCGAGYPAERLDLHEGVAGLERSDYRDTPLYIQEQE